MEIEVQATESRETAAIEIQNLSKAYGANKALDNISFSVKKGEVMGFLGPNGAGKSTTMNILTGYLAASKGMVLIDGVDVLENPDKYKINGQSTKADSFKSVYQQVIGVAFVDYGDFQPKEQFMTVTYSMKNGEEIVIKYYEYNERYYLAERKGKRMTVLKTDMSDLFYTLDNAN